MSEIDDNYQHTIDFGGNVIKNSETYSEYYADHTKITPLIRVPALILIGRNDPAFGINHYRSFRFPAQIVKHIAGGHLFYYENNDTLVKTVSEFINRFLHNAVSRKRV